MDYKHTLNLPRTDFPMKADLVTREPERLKQWEAAGLYAKIQAARAGAPKFVLHDGPPFANGDVHIGTALNKILKDIIIKYKTLRGFSAPYIPGWDCHGLPIEFKVSQEMRKQQRAADVPSADQTSSACVAGRNEDGTSGRTPEARSDFSAAAIRKACEAYARKFIDIQRTQFKRLGVLGDWENPYLTLNKEYEADELRLFADIVEQGFVYRGKKPVYWSIPCRTALAEAEVEYQDHVSQSCFVKFPIVDRPGVSLLIWTTTPWTLPANLAVAYNSTFSYSLVRVGGEEFIVSAMLLSTVAQKCGWQDYQIIRRLEYQHPFCNRTGKLLAGDTFVTNDTGTGFVHIAPGHGMDDYHLGNANGLPIYSPVDDDGRFAHTGDLPVEQQMPAEMLGKSILEKHGKSDANEAVLHELRVRHALLHQENYHHSYPHCWRSKTPIIFRAMDQWFIEIDHVVGTRSTASQTDFKDNGDAVENVPTFRERALAEIDRVTWIPDWGVNRIKSAVQSRPDWCISRQRSWGVPIPAFYDAKGEPILDAQIVRNTADLIQQHGSNVWFEKCPEELWTLLKPKNWQGAEAVAKSSDTLDVWIDSGSSSRAVMMQRPELQRAADILSADQTCSPATAKPEEDGTSGKMPEARFEAARWQADVYLEGSDQHRGWFQSSLLLSLAGNGAAPYKTVLTHGFMVDADREKISKSKQGQGGYEKPQTAEAYVKKYGADVVRLWVASQDYRSDIIVSEERIAKVAETYRGIRNALRYQLSNLYDFDPTKHTVHPFDLTPLDRWILGEYAKLERDVWLAYDAFEFHVVYQRVSQFAAVELSAVYHDVIKDRLYTDPASSQRRRATQTALYYLVTGLCQMLAPILAFTADEAWESVPGRPVDSIHLASWTPDTVSVFPKQPIAWRNFNEVLNTGTTYDLAAERGVFTELFKLRERVLVELEKARQAKLVGKSLDAKLTLKGTESGLKIAFANQETFRELLNVSRLDVVPDAKLAELEILVTKADGEKCERCWHWETDVGQNTEHPTLCSRCVEAVKQSKA
jgi:isoleucyl-tRNA synthetase